MKIWSLTCRYTAEQTEILEKKAKKAIPNQIHFLKILKTCKEIKWVFLVPDVWATHPVLKSEPSHLIEETHFVCLQPQSPSFGNYPGLITQIGTTEADASTNHISISCSIFLSFINNTLTTPPVNKTSFAWGRSSLPTRRGWFTKFQQGILQSHFILSFKPPHWLLEVTDQRSQQSHIICKRERHFNKVGYSELMFSANSSQNLPLSDLQYPYTRPTTQPHGTRPGHQVWLQEVTLVSHL